MSATEKSERPLLSRIISLEGVIAAYGIYSLGSGLWQGDLIPIFWGATILAGLVVLAAVRRRDWKKHWQLQAEQHAPTPPHDPRPPQA